MQHFLHMRSAGRLNRGAIANHQLNWWLLTRVLQDNPDCFDLVEWVLFDTHTESVYEAEVDKLYEENRLCQKN